ncbi:MAG TPA: tyrosine-type recombinase/integrase [Dehalococcoidia bacterium]|jgi:integrase
MARKAKKLLSNDREVKAARPPAPKAWTGENRKTYNVAEYRVAGAPNLLLRVAPDSRKRWSYRFKRPRTDKWSYYAVGEYPAVGLADARKEAVRLRRMVIDGEDPIDARDGRGATPTFAKLGAEYIQRHAKAKKRSWQEDERILTKNVNPKLGDVRADLVTSDDVRRLLDAIEDRGAPVMANRTLAVVRKVYNWARADGRLRMENPAARMGLRGNEKPRTRALSDDELRGFWAALDGHGFDDVTADALRFQLLTVARVDEVCGMTRDELSLQGLRLVWTVPAERAKKDADIMRPLPRLAVAIIRNRLDGADSDYVFASPFGDDAPLDEQSPARAIRRAEKRGLVPPDFHTHDLRRTATTNCVKLRIGEHITRRLLGHATRRTDTLGRHYDQHDYLPEMFQALRLWERRLLQITALREAPPKNDMELPAAGKPTPTRRRKGQRRRA